MPPKRSSYVLTWTPKGHVYELHFDGVLQQQIGIEDGEAWQHWLGTLTSFSFRGRQGHLSILKEARTRGEGYWYAYAYMGRHKKKRYLGTTRAVTLAHLEETASMLSHQSALSPQAIDMEAQLPVPTPFFSAPTPFPNVLLLPKLSPPRLPATLLTRERLFTHLDQALTHPLTLLSASAGFGKTTLLSAWVTRTISPDIKFAWLSLDERDNDPARFWTYIIAALRMRSAVTEHRQSELGETALTMFYSPQPPNLLAILTTLINDLTVGQEEIVLVLDDYHVIDDPAITNSFQFLLEHLPHGLHVILAGRSDPPLKLSRLRARGRIVEIWDRDLRFTQAETEHFLIQTMHLPLTEAEVRVLEQRSEGWITGLQLAALAMRTRTDHTTFVQQFNGNQRFILEYMQEEILERQSPEVRDFLLKTAILTRLHASLCQAVIGETTESACRQMLSALEKTNLFLTSLDEERHWYRFHSLFRDVLQTRLQAVFPDLVPILHQRAAHWYAQQGDIHVAIVHALAGTDYAFAATLMEQSSEQMWLNGKGATLYTWIMQLPDKILLAHASLALTSVLHLFFHAYYAPDEQWNQATTRAEQTMERIESLLDGQAEALPPEEECLLHNRLEFLHGWQAARELYTQEKISQMQPLIARMLELVQEDTIVWKMFPVSSLSLFEANLATLIPLYTELKQQAEREKHGYEVVWSMDLLSQAYYQRGQLELAYQTNLDALQRLQQVGKARSMFGYVHLDLARFHWARNQLAEARVHLDTALQFARTWQHIELQIRGYCQIIPIFLAEGKLAEAEKALIEAERLSQQGSWRRHHVRLGFVQTRIWLSQGNLDAAIRWVTRCDLDPQMRMFYTDPTFIEYITLPLITLPLVQVYLALERYDKAHQLLASLLVLLEQNQDIWNMVQVLALQVLTLQASGESMQARKSALRLLQLAEPTDYVRMYLDIGAPMQQVLQGILNDFATSPEQHNTQVPLNTLRALLTAFEQQAKPNIQRGQPSSLLSKPSLSSPTSPLTVREQEVLHLLVQGATNQDIADHLVISLATAKKHVTNILNKLGAENRVQAIARARDYELL